MTTVAIIGLGAMGSRIAERFLDAGHQVVVWNRTPDKAQPLVARGASQADTPGDAAGRADLVAIIVSDPAALRAVTERPDGIASGIGDATVAQMSTVEPQAVAALAAALPEGTGVLDAPVLGSLSEAESGTLKVFLGGTPELVERWSPTLSAIGTPMYVGGLGTGTAAKLLANSALLASLSAVGEALALADALDLPTDVAFDVLSVTPLGAQANRRREAVTSGDYPLRFSLGLALKDADLITGTANTHGVDMRIAAAVRSWYAHADHAGRRDEDYSAIIDHILRS
ncbi:MAG: NAD(P)-dependent oxidoreductase [Micromonosporaceae bacterium]